MFHAPNAFTFDAPNSGGVEPRCAVEMEIAVEGTFVAGRSGGLVVAGHPTVDGATTPRT